MLKYRININNFQSDNYILPIEKFSITDFDDFVIEDGDDGVIEYDGINKGKLLIVCTCEKAQELYVGKQINIDFTLELEIDRYTVKQTVDVVAINKEQQTFSFYIDKYYELYPFSCIRLQDYETLPILEEDNKTIKQVSISFDNEHFFNNYFEYTDDNDIVIYFQYTEGNKEIKVAVPFLYQNPRELVTDVSVFETPEQKALYKRLFGIDVIPTSEYNNDYSNDYANQNVEEIEDENEEEKNPANSDIEGNLIGIRVFRDGFIFNERSTMEIWHKQTTMALPICLTNTFETNLHQTDLVNTKFVQNEINKIESKIVDLEKDVYLPVIANKTIIDNQVTTTFTDIQSIKFNLHFREHRGENWVVETNSFWNGVEQLKETVSEPKVIGSIENGLTGDNYSDLLGYVGFTNDDVYYQKNKLKKSFLRLLFYDSLDTTNQNLLATATIFVDCGFLFKKYIQNTVNNLYEVITSKICGKYTYDTYSEGIKVNREPVGNENQRTFEENERLSSQFVVRNKQMSTHSSEGFCLYLWKSNASTIPQDLFMRVEFNHAGYGRTIPFMMPFWDKNKWANGDYKNSEYNNDYSSLNVRREGIKTMQEILDDWNSLEDENGNWFLQTLQEIGKERFITTTETRTDGHYGFRQYRKFSHIHLKYQYNPSQDKYMYYLDNDTYGNGIKAVKNSDGENELIINLYEAKVE